MVRPEPSTNRRPRKRWPNEEHPLTLRIGAIRDELDARTNGTTREYRQVIMRDLKRYYEWISLESSYTLPVNNIDVARSHYKNIITLAREVEWPEDLTTRLVYLVIVDSCERAHILVQHAGLSVDEALIAVGLVSEKE